jgi:HK97 gp10 family phage protein
MLQKIEKTEQKRLGEIGKDLSQKISVAAPKKTGELRASIGYEQDELNVEVTVSAPYWKFVEFGTRRNKPQPFMRPTFQKEKQNIAKKLGKKIL